MDEYIEREKAKRLLHIEYAYAAEQLLDEIPATSKEDARALVDEYNGKLGVSRAQEEAMKTGSMFGWNVPGADPKNYDMDGKPLKPKDRDDAR